MKRVLIISFLAMFSMGSSCSGCSSSSGPYVDFEMYSQQGGEQAFNDAWSAARANPVAGMQYNFPIVSENIAEGAVVKLYAGRPTGVVTGSDVVVDGERLLATSEIRADGTAEFPPLDVVDGEFTSDTAQLPIDLLCGSTEIVVRAYKPATIGPQLEFLAAAWFTARSAPCN